MSVGHIAKTITGTIALGATTALGFLPHTDPWFNVLTGVVAGLGAYGVYAVPNKAATPQEQAIGAAVGAVATELASGFTAKWDPAASATLGKATEAIAPAKTFPAAAIAAVAEPVAAPVTIAPVYEAPAAAPEPAPAAAPVEPVAPTAGA